MSLTKNAAIPRTVPFALFMAFIGLEEVLRLLAGKGVIALPGNSLLYLYPLKTFSVAVVLLLVLPRCREISLRDLANIGRTTVSIVVGLILFILWINMDWQFGTFGKPQGFNPTLIQDDFIRFAMTMVRVAGAVIVVPVMEEIFWRSFLVRYIIDQDFTKVPIGRFTWPSFLISMALFGMEHNLFLAGMMAGVAYNLLLYYSKSISQCIVAHAVTNLALGIYVISTGKWYFW
jgi:uncharacterized protein